MRVSFYDDVVSEIEIYNYGELDSFVVYEILNKITHRDEYWPYLKSRNFKLLTVDHLGLIIYVKCSIDGIVIHFNVKEILEKLFDVASVRKFQINKLLS